MNTNNIQQKKVYLRAESIFKFLTEDHEKLDTVIMCNTDQNLITTDQSLYEALGSIHDKKVINLNKLVKLLEVTEINSFVKMMNKERTILKEDRVEEIRKKAENIN